MDMARQKYLGFPGLTVLSEQDFGAQPGDLNPLGYKDSIGQPAIEGSGVDPLPGQGPAIKAGEFVLGYPARTACRCRCRRQTCLGGRASWKRCRPGA